MYAQLHSIGKELTRKEVLIGGVAALGCTILVRAGFTAKRRHDLRKRGEKKRQQTKDAIEALRKKLSDDPSLEGDLDYIISLSFSELQAKLQTRELSAVRVLRAYQLKALRLNDRINCLTEIVEEAEEWARDLDSKAEPIGELHGIPYSIKDHYPIAGYDCAMGSLRLVGLEHEEDCATVMALKAHGAVPFVKTTVPQGMTTPECLSTLCGLTLNPLDSKRGAAGSSGGEGALIGGWGSLVGMGSDMGGSIRIPCHFSGICGIKPTSKRLTMYGDPISDWVLSYPMPGSLGPMARDVDALVATMKALNSDVIYKEDTYLQPLTFNTQIYEDTRPLRIGFIVSEGHHIPLPPCQRAVEEAKSILKNQGHTLVPFTWGQECFFQAHATISRAWGCDGGAGIYGAVEDETNTLRPVITLWSFPAWFRRMIGTLVRPFNPYLANHMIGFGGCRTPTDAWNLNLDIMKFQREYEAKWKAANIDALICPALNVIALPHDYFPKVHDPSWWAWMWSSLYNIMDFTAGVLPMVTINRKDMEELESYPQTKTYYKLAKEMMTDSIGLPVCVQVVTPPWRDEACLRVMKELENGSKVSRAEPKSK